MVLAPARLGIRKNAKLTGNVLDTFNRVNNTALTLTSQHSAPWQYVAPGCNGTLWTLDTNRARPPASVGTRSVAWIDSTGYKGLYGIDILALTSPGSGGLVWNLSRNTGASQKYYQVSVSGLGNQTASVISNNSGTFTTLWTTSGVVAAPCTILVDRTVAGKCQVTITTQTATYVSPLLTDTNVPYTDIVGMFSENNPVGISTYFDNFVCPDWIDYSVFYSDNFNRVNQVLDNTLWSNGYWHSPYAGAVTADVFSNTARINAANGVYAATGLNAGSPTERGIEWTYVSGILRIIFCATADMQDNWQWEVAGGGIYGNLRNGGAASSSATGTTPVAGDVYRVTVSNTNIARFYRNGLPLEQYNLAQVAALTPQSTWKYFGIANDGTGVATLGDNVKLLSRP